MSDSRDVATQSGGLSVPTNSLLNFLAAAARDPTVDIAKFEALLRMQREIIADEAKSEFNAALAVVQADMEPVVRDADNKQTKSRYAKLETIDAAIRPIYTKHGFSLTFDTVQHDGPEIRMVCEVSRGRHSRVYHLDAMPDVAGAQGVVNKTQMHGVASAVTYLRRYLTTMIFNVVLRNEDDDGNVGGGTRNGVIDNIVDAAMSQSRQAGNKGKPADRPWIEVTKTRLDGEHNAWKWISLLLTALRDVPSFDDLVALETYGPIVQTRKTAPDPERVKIDDAFAGARQRLNKEPAPQQQDGKPPATTSAEQSTKKEEPEKPAFDHFAFDAAGDEVQNEDGLPMQFSNAADFALWYRGAFVATKEREALADHNADALAEARLSPVAKATLDDCEIPDSTPTDEAKAEPEAQAQPPAEEEPAQRKVVPLQRAAKGGPDWTFYNTAISEDWKTVTTVAEMDDWVALNEVVYRSNRQPGSRSNFTARISPMIEEKYKALRAGPPRDSDMERALVFIEEWKKAQTQTELDQIGANGAIKAFATRMTKERPEILKMMIEADADAAARVKVMAASLTTAPEEGDGYGPYGGKDNQ